MSPNNKTSSKAGSLAIYIESYLFPILFVLFSVNHLLKIIANKGAITEFFRTKNLLQLTLPDLIFLSDLLILIAIIIFNLLLTYGLIVRKKLHQKPDGFLEIFIPFIATFWTFLYNIIVFMPTKINYLLVPKEFFQVSILVGSCLAFAGLLLACLALISLRKSFGIFVQVRDIVTKGLYKYVRHPMYFAHIMIHSGFLLITPRLYYLILCLALILVTLFRAKLEEQKLSKFSQDYQEYMKKTPFILPIKFKK